MIVRYSEKYINGESSSVITIILILDLLIFGAAMILFFEKGLGVWYLILVGLLVVVLDYGLVKARKNNKHKELMRKHSLEINGEKLLFSWPDSRYEIFLKEVEKIVVKKSKKGIEKIRLKTKTGREIDIKGYESMQELFDGLLKSGRNLNISYAKWYWLSDL